MNVLYSYASKSNNEIMNLRQYVKDRFDGVLRVTASGGGMEVGEPVVSQKCIDCSYIPLQFVLARNP